MEEGASVVCPRHRESNATGATNCGHSLTSTQTLGSQKFLISPLLTLDRRHHHHPKQRKRDK